MRIPCYLTNRDLLSPIRGMVEHLLACDHVGPITVIDCASTYEPLLFWYAHGCSSEVRVIRSEENIGPHAPWRYIEKGHAYYFTSDGDLDLRGVPADFLEVLKEGLELYPERIKCGLSLALDDIPHAAPAREKVLAIEEKFWLDPLPAFRGGFFGAEIDTTAALYRGGHGWRGYGPALRSAPPYTARHLAWYLTPETITEEWRWFFEHLNPQGIVWSQTLREQFGIGGHECSKRLA